METNAIVISHQTPQQAIPGGVPKKGEKLWFVVADDGNTYKPTKICIANSDKWSDPLDFTGVLNGAGLTQPQADALYATIAQGNKADSALQPGSNLDATKLTGMVPLTSIPADVTTDTELSAAIAEITAASLGAASLVSGKVPAAQSRPSNVVYDAPTGMFNFTWADGSTQSVDTVMESLLQASNYNSTTKTVTFTRANGTTLDVPLSDLVDLPEIVIDTQAPSTNPTTGQKLYIRRDNGDYYASTGTAWAGPYSCITASERTQLAGLTTALAEKQAADPTLQSIADSTATGLIQRNANETVTLLPTGAMAGPLLAAGDAAAVRGVAGINQNITLSSTTVGVSPRLLLTGAGQYPWSADFSGGAVFALSANLPGNRQLVLFDSANPPTAGAIRFLISNDPVIDAVSIDGNTRLNMGFGTPTTNVAFGGVNIASSKATFYGEPSKRPAMFYASTGALPVQFYNDSTGAVGEIDTLLSRVTFNQYKFTNGATQTASLRGSKTIGTPSTADTITVVGAAVGDIVHLSRGKDGFVSTDNTVTFDSSGLAGVVVSAIVERFV